MFIHYYCEQQWASIVIIWWMCACAYFSRIFTAVGLLNSASSVISWILMELLNARLFWIKKVKIFFLVSNSQKFDISNQFWSYQILIWILQKHQIIGQKNLKLPEFVATLFVFKLAHSVLYWMMVVKKVIVIMRWFTGGRRQFPLVWICLED